MQIYSYVFLHVFVFFFRLTSFGWVIHFSKTTVASARYLHSLNFYNLIVENNTIFCCNPIENKSLNKFQVVSCAVGYSNTISIVEKNNEKTQENEISFVGFRQSF